MRLLSQVAIRALFSSIAVARSCRQRWPIDADRGKGQQRTAPLCRIYQLKCLSRRSTNSQPLPSASTQSFIASNAKVQNKRSQNAYTTICKHNTLKVAVSHRRRSHQRMIGLFFVRLLYDVIILPSTDHRTH